MELKKTLLLLACLIPLCMTQVFSQEPESKESKKIRKAVEREFRRQVREGEVRVDSSGTIVKRPEFVRGLGSGSFSGWVLSRIEYPREYWKNRTSKIVVRFVVRKDGRFTDAEIVESNNADLNPEVMKIISSIPQWEVPGTVNGEPVDFRLTLPIIFLKSKGPEFKPDKRSY